MLLLIKMFSFSCFLVQVWIVAKNRPNASMV